MAEEAKALYTKHCPHRTMPTIDEIVSVVLAEIPRHSVVFVVVDVLDECPEEGRVRTGFVRRLQHIMTSTNAAESKLLLLMTSRLAKPIFPNANEIEIRATDDDIERLVCQRIEDGLSDDEIPISVRKHKEFGHSLVAVIVK